MAKSSRTQQVKFLVSKNELKMIDARVCSLNFGSRASYLRKMAVNGVVINIDMSEIQKLTSAIGAIENNINQAVHKINTYGLNLNDTEVIKSYEVNQKMNSSQSRTFIAEVIDKKTRQEIKVHISS